MHAGGMSVLRSPYCHGHGRTKRCSRPRQPVLLCQGLTSPGLPRLLSLGVRRIEMKSTRPWRYSSALAVDESNCVVANPDKQNYTVVAETVYYSMKLGCKQCHNEFWFPATEQRVWYEDWRFWIDSVPNQCAACRKASRKTDGGA
jgi:hypothetical protein